MFSSQNDVDQGTVPNELQHLTEIEEILIARACTIMCVYCKHGGQRGYKGHVLNLPQDIKEVLARLPPSVAERPFLMIRRYGADNTHRSCRVRRLKGMQAITWYKDNNPFNSDIVIYEESLQRLPRDGVPENLPSLHFQENEEETEEQRLTGQGTLQNHENGADKESSYFLLLQDVQQKKQEAIRAFINSKDPLDWPSNEEDPVSEVHTEVWKAITALRCLCSLYLVFK